MKYLIILLSFCSIVAQAQYIVQPYGDMQGTPLKEIKYENVDGTPYLFDYWIKGKVTLKSGKQYKDMPIKYDVMNDKLIFQAENGNMMHFTEPVSAFEINDIASATNYKFTNGLPATDGQNLNSFYQLIASGKVSLFKKPYKKISEHTVYGSATVNKSFDLRNDYYILQNGSLSKINITKKSLLAIAPNKEKEITDYLKKEKTDFKQDTDLNKFFNYLNEL
ncbi:hypothetical protein [Pedobacter sp. UBA5917]|jgi:hypothetical protein|uniref:hypothetical protein n=1 Tax=Pedobacter sp. UBA5917 TaxID=1947061 RepID=UPI0025F94305|nr:hypothetical protein [Pedobacter sp. UBA5917]